MSPPMTRDQVRLVDRIAADRFGMSELVLMENAGRNATDLTLSHFCDEDTFFIVCGSGNNGGDGCVMARHLHNAGKTVMILLSHGGTRMSECLRANLQIAQKMEIPVMTHAQWVEDPPWIATAGVIVECLLGTGFQGTVREPVAGLIQMINASGRPVVAIDMPSGLDADTGAAGGVAINAALTITFVAEKAGFSNPQARKALGKVVVADIGAPRQAIQMAMSPSEPHA
ncbi:MAG: NAD(P)H-hydrate epimerase [Planctomycetota bacterium]